MNIALVLPHLYFLPDISRESIFAPGELFYSLALGLSKKGHKVTIFASNPINETNIENIIGSTKSVRDEQKRKSMTVLELQRKHPRLYKKAYQDFQNDLLQKLKAKEKQFDLIHIFAIDNERFLEFGQKSKKKVVYTNHDPYDFNKALKKSFIKYKDLNYISISKSQQILGLNFIANIYNSIDINNFEFEKTPKDYFASIGRIIYPKGVHRAIEVCKRAKVKLKIAGKYYLEFGDKYFPEKIEPHIDNKKIFYEGFINDIKQKSNFLKNAKALLFPIDWSEPFGLVMIEAMACGTPVIAFDRGAVREIVEDGVTGFIVNTKSEMVAAIKKISKINRKTCRSKVQSKFNNKKMINEYELTYQRLIV